MRTIYLGENNQYETLVSDEDYSFLLQWRWNFLRSRGGNIYARRTSGRSEFYDGSRTPGFTLLMHVVIMERKGDIKPSEKHTPDHKNGLTLDNRRDNLVWASKHEQAINRKPYRLRISKRSELVYFSKEEIPF